MKAPTLRKVALTGDLDYIDRWLDELCARGEPGAWAPFLVDARYDPEAFTDDGEPVGDLSAGAGLKALRARDQRRLDHAFRALLARAPAGASGAVKLRDKVTSLALRTATTAEDDPVDLRPLAGFPRLRRLLLRRCLKVVGVEALERFPALEHLHLEGCGLPDLSAFVRCHTIQTLTFDSLDDGGDLTMVRSLTNLTHLRLRGVRTLRSLAGLTDLPALRALELDLSAEAKVSDLSPLASLRALERLTLRGARGLRDVSPLTRCASLRLLDLQGCAALADVSALEALPGLRVLCLHGTAVKASGLRALRSIASFARDANAEALLAQDAAVAALAARPSELVPESWPLWPKLAPLLLSTDAETVDQGIELAASLGDKGLVEAILHGTTWVPEVRRVGRETWDRVTAGGFSFGPALRAPRGTTAFRERALLGLLAAFPSGVPTADALREAAVTLDLDGYVRPRQSFTGDGDYAPLDLGPVAGLPRLERLRLARASRVTRLEALRSAPALRSLHALGAPLGSLEPLRGHATLEELVVSSRQLQDVGALGAMPALRRCDLDTFTLPGDGALGLGPALESARLSLPRGSVLAVTAPALRSLRVDRCEAPRVLDLCGCPALESLELVYPGELIVRVGGCGALRRLALSSSQRPLRFEGLATCASLRELSLWRVWQEPQPEVYQALFTLPTLVSVTVSEVPPAVDLGLLGGAPGLETLELSETGVRPSLAGLERCMGLRAVTLRDCRLLTDLSALEALPGLEHLTITELGRPRCPPGLSPRLSAMLTE
ncbi:MAG: hypothetical protein HY909_04810 [Deltaproteobacteria bacterium]|nr:hypothetical protein [Deltaproteobacteria bacterium]